MKTSLRQKENEGVMKAHIQHNKLPLKPFTPTHLNIGYIKKFKKIKIKHRSSLMVRINTKYENLDVK